MRRQILLLLILFIAPALAISPHRLSMETVVHQADWVAVVKVVGIEETGNDHGSGLEVKVEVLRAIEGEVPASPANLNYFEAWPSRDPEGKTEAPIWTGSGMERELKVGDEFIAICRGLGLSRAEPLSAEPEVRRVLQERGQALSPPLRASIISPQSRAKVELCQGRPFSAPSLHSSGGLWP